MITVTIVLPDRTRKAAEIDPSVSIDKIKADIVRGLKLGNPDDFEVFFSPKLKKEALQNYIPTSGDVIFLVRAEDTGSSSVRFLDGS